MNLLILVILTFFGVENGFSQRVIYKEDSRIIKYRTDIIQYLIKVKQIDATIPFDLEDFDFKINFIKCLDIYSDAPKLLIMFSLSGDHYQKFWGVLSDKEKYFFSDPDNVEEPDVLPFEKKCDSMIVSIVRFYCYINPPEHFGLISETFWIYQKNLRIIKDALYSKIGLNTTKVDSTVAFFNSTTQIKPANYAQNRHLTREDYSKWLNWYKENGSKLYWDDKEKKMKVK